MVRARTQRLYMQTPIGTRDGRIYDSVGEAGGDRLNEWANGSAYGLGTTYGTGELAPVGGRYQMVGHEIPASARCSFERRGATIEVRRHTPLPGHEACGQGALWCLTSTGGWSYSPRVRTSLRWVTD